MVLTRLPCSEHIFINLNSPVKCSHDEYDMTENYLVPYSPPGQQSKPLKEIWRRFQGHIERQGPRVLLQDASSSTDTDKGGR